MMATSGDSNSGDHYSGWTHWQKEDANSGNDFLEWTPPPPEWKAPPLHLVESWAPSPFWDEIREFLVWPTGFDDSYSSSSGFRRRTAICAGKPWETHGPRPRAVSLDNFGLRTSSPFASEDIIVYAVGRHNLRIAAESRQQQAVPESHTGSTPRDVTQALGSDANPKEDHSDAWDEGAWVSQGHQAVLEPSLTPTNQNATTNAPISPKGKENRKEPFKADQSLSQPIAQLTIDDLITNLCNHDLQITGYSDCPCEVDRWSRQRRRENACCCLCHLGEGVRSAPSWRNRSYTHYCEVYVEWLEIRDRYDSMPCKCLFVDGEYVGDFGGHHDSDEDEGLGCSYDDLSWDDVASWVESESDGESQGDIDHQDFDRAFKVDPFRTSDLPNPFSGDRVAESTLTEDHIAEETGVEVLQDTNTIVSQVATTPEVANGDTNESATSSVVSPSADTQNQTEAHAHQVDQNTLVSGYVSGPLSIAWYAVVATITDKVVSAALPALVVSLFRRGFNFIFSCVVALAAMPSSIAKKIDDLVLKFEYRLRLGLLKWRRWRKISKQVAIKVAVLDKAITRGYSTVAALQEDYVTFTDAVETTEEIQELSDIDELILWWALLSMYSVLLVSFVAIVEVILNFLGLEVGASGKALMKWFLTFELLLAIHHT